jgi:hypothetical protein
VWCTQFSYFNQKFKHTWQCLIYCLWALTCAHMTIFFKINNLKELISNFWLTGVIHSITCTYILKTLKIYQFIVIFTFKLFLDEKWYAKKKRHTRKLVFWTKKARPWHTLCRLGAFKLLNAVQWRNFWATKTIARGIDTQTVIYFYRFTSQLSWMLRDFRSGESKKRFSLR